MNQKEGDILDEIFEKSLKSPRIFRNKSVLFHDYIPHRLLFREEYIARLAHIFSPLLRGQRSSNLFIYGKPGTGKTAVTRYVLIHLKQKAQKFNIGIYISYINCRIAGTEYRVASLMARDIGVRVPFTGLSVEEVINRLRSKLAGDNYPLLLVLDEIDYLVTKHGDDLLYTLTRFNNSEGQYLNSLIVGISNDLRFKEYLDPRVLSSLSEEEMVFKPYTPAELEAILMDRAREAFHDGVISRDVIRLCAAISGSEHGDARKALDLLRIAGEIAEEEGANRLTVEHVYMARDRMEKDKTMEVVLSLPLHSKLALAAVYLCSLRGMTSVRSSIAYAKYVELTKILTIRPISNRHFIGLIKELAILGLLDRRIENFGRKGGRVTMIQLAIPMAEMERVLKEDSSINELISDEA